MISFLNLHSMNHKFLIIRFKYLTASNSLVLLLFLVETFIKYLNRVSKKKKKEKKKNLNRV